MKFGPRFLNVIKGLQPNCEAEGKQSFLGNNKFSEWHYMRLFFLSISVCTGGVTAGLCSASNLNISRITMGWFSCALWSAWGCPQAARHVGHLHWQVSWGCPQAGSKCPSASQLSLGCSEAQIGLTRKAPAFSVVYPGRPGPGLALAQSFLMWTGERSGHGLTCLLLG